MTIQTKLEEIRQLPEHIRMRYLIGSVGISMFFIGLLWIFSLTTSFQTEKPAQNALNSIPHQEIEQKKVETESTPQSTQQETPSLNEWIKK